MNIYDVKNLSFKYNDRNEIFSSANLTIEEGKIYALLGRNGVGKSTLFSILLNVINNYTGDVLFLGDNIKKLSRKQIAKNVGYVPQNPHLSFDFNAKDYVAMGLVAETNLFSELKKEDYKKVDEAFNKLSINHLKDKNFFEMSGGEKQLVVIARSIVLNPKIVLFDEPTSHLDIANQYKVLKIIKSLKNNGYTIVVSTHDPNQVTLLDENVIILDGSKKIKSGKAIDTINKNTLNDLYDVDMEVEYLEKHKRKICFFENI